MARRFVAVLTSALCLLGFPFPSSSQAAGCPVINGKYIIDTTRDGKPVRFFTIIHTKIDSGVYSYMVSKDGTFQAADGIARPIKVGDRTGKAKVSCTKTTVVREFIADDTGDVTFGMLTPINARQLRFESDDTHRNGIYSLEK